MKVFCRTNIDIFKREIWPKEMCCRPIEGDRVQSENGISLRVVGVTHLMTKKYEDCDCPDELFLIVELHN